MLDWLRPDNIVSPLNFHRAFLLIQEVILSTHKDDILKCFEDTKYIGKDYLYPLQLLHLTAKPSYLPFLCYVMAAYVASQIIKPEHLLVLGSCDNWDYNLTLPSSLIQDQQLVKMLFHNTKVPTRIFMQFYFVKIQECSYLDKKTQKKLIKYYKSQRYEEINQVVLKKIIKHHVEKRFQVYTSMNGVMLGKRKLNDDVSSSAINLLKKIEKKNLKRHWISILRAVADYQNIDVLNTLLAKVQEFWPRGETTTQVLRHYMTGVCDESDYIIDILRVALMPC
jgi:hypothetical protein